MNRIAVVYWSGTGNTQAMAEAVAAAASAELFPAAKFSADMLAAYEGIAFGCPSMGSEQLEEDEFLPMWESVKRQLADKKIALFGSYGWGVGEWMDTWKAECNGMNLVGTYICQEAPDEDALSQCRALGEAMKS